ncbi:MAG: inorganic phosphate transporter [Candidatus Latescibacterota bacterium]
MSALFNYLTIPFLLAMFLAINMGGSGTAPAFSAAYGSRAIRRQLIPGLFGIMVLAGALIAGKQVSLTLGRGLLDQAYFTPLNTSIILLSIALSLLGANLIGVPQSTSQSTVLSIAGAATALEGPNRTRVPHKKSTGSRMIQETSHAERLILLELGQIFNPHTRTIPKAAPHRRRLFFGHTTAFSSKIP